MASKLFRLIYNILQNYLLNRSGEQNTEKTGSRNKWHEFMSQDEITVMDRRKCIFYLRSVSSFLSNKFDIIKHKNYKLWWVMMISVFNIEAYIRRKGSAGIIGINKSKFRR